MMRFTSHECHLNLESYTDRVLKTPDHELHWTERFRRWLTMQTTVSNNIKNNVYRSEAAHVRAARNHLESTKDWYILHPFSNIRWIWNGFMAVVYLFAFFFIPLNMAVRTPGKIDVHRLVLDIIFICDICMTFFTGFVVEETDQIVMSHRLIRKNYLRSYFLVDAISSIPSIYVTRATDEIDMFFFDFLKLLKLFRLGTAAQYVRMLFSRFRIGSNYGFNIFSRLVLILVFILHWLTALIMFLPELLEHYTNELHDSWIVNKELIDQMHRGETINAYLHALEFVIAMLIGDLNTMGGPETTTDVIISIFIIVTGYAYFAYLLVIVVNYVLTNNWAEIQYQSKMSQLRTYMLQNRLPQSMQSKLVSYYEYRFQYRYFRDTSIMSMLSTHLKADVTMFTCHRLLNSVFLFRNLRKEVLSDLTNSMRPEIFLPNDILIRAGSLGRCMYWLVTGTVAILSPNGKEVCHLEDGAHFGEVALLKRDSRRVASVVAIEFCEVYSLSSEDFRRVVLRCIELADRLRMIAIDRQDATSNVDRGAKDQLRPMKKKTLV